MIRASNQTELSFSYPIILSFLSQNELSPLVTIRGKDNAIFRKMAFQIWSKNLKEISASDFYIKIKWYQKLQEIPFHKFSNTFPSASITFNVEDLYNISLLSLLKKNLFPKIMIKANSKNITPIAFENLVLFFPNSKYLQLENHIEKQRKIIWKDSKLINSNFEKIAFYSYNLSENIIFRLPKTLRSLTISHSTISSYALDNLRRIPIQKLKLYCCSLTDAHLRIIETIHSIKVLNIIGNFSISYRGVKRMLKANPSIKAFTMNNEIYYLNHNDIKKNFPTIRFYIPKSQCFKDRRHSI